MEGGNVTCAIGNSGEYGDSLQSVRGAGNGRHTENHLLIFAGAVIVSIAGVFIARMRVPGGVNANALGWMSVQWLAEYRASHPA